MSYYEITLILKRNLRDERDYFATQLIGMRDLRRVIDIL